MPGRGAARFLEPRVLIGGVIDHQLRDHPQPALVRGREKRLKIRERSVVRIDVVVIGDVVAVIAQRRRIKGQKPDRGDAQFLEIIELLDQSAKIADAVAVAVVEGLDVQLIDDGVFVPERIDGGITRRLCHAANSWRNNSRRAIVRLLTKERRFPNRRWGRFVNRPSLGIASHSEAATGSEAAHERYFFGSAIAEAATHCQTPFRSTQVSVKRKACEKGFPADVLPVSRATPVTTATPGRKCGPSCRMRRRTCRRSFFPGLGNHRRFVPHFAAGGSANEVICHQFLDD